MSDVAEISDKALEQLLDNLEEIPPKIIYKALVAGGKELYKGTKNNLRRKMGETSNSLMKGVRYKAKKSNMLVQVDILGDYRLKWFEKGTKDRYTRRKHAYRGRIKALSFFKQAREDSSVINKILSTLDKELKKLE
jgi:hypothetical protein